MKKLYFGLFMISLATLMFELLLTRIWSVTMWYHMAFMAISVSMFGITFGAILVYLLPRLFSEEKIHKQLAISAFLFAVSIVLSLLIQLDVSFAASRSFSGMLPAALTFCTAAIPFCFSGICVALILSRFPRYVSRLYAADLIGAALGSVLFALILNFIDGLTAVIVVALFASIGCLTFALGWRSRRFVVLSVCLCLFLSVFSAINAVFAYQQHPLLSIHWVKNGPEPHRLYEKWNSFSRISVSGDPTVSWRPFLWGASPCYRPDHTMKQLWLAMDAMNQTILTNFAGDFRALDYLKFDVTNIAYYLRQNADVLIIGAGGGRDVLSALTFGERSVEAVDINGDIINTVNRKFGDFTCHLDKDPRITFIADEARSYIEKQKKPYDIIQLTLINTGVASSSSAYAFTENALYTVQAWKIFLGHLKPDGLITCAGQYLGSSPMEIYRFTALAQRALSELGIKNPQDHIAVVRRPHEAWDVKQTGFGTIIVSKEPFSKKDLLTLNKVTSNLKFELIQSPQVSRDGNLKIIASGNGYNQLVKSFPVRIDAPTDDNPFFFFALRPQDILTWSATTTGVDRTYTKAMILLNNLIIIVIALTGAAIILPMLFSGRKNELRREAPLIAFFASIGLGYMFIEISQIERLIIFLGHPTYSLTVSLPVLLIGTGIGSYLTGGEDNSQLRRAAIRRVIVLLCAFAVFAGASQYMISIAQDQSNVVRLAIASALLFPLGLFMGMMLPLGLKLAAQRCAPLIPWLWGINGAASVCASVLALAIVINLSITAAFITGCACYLAALISLVYVR